MCSSDLFREMLLGRRDIFLGADHEVAELLGKRGEGGRPVEQPLIDLDAHDRVTGIEADIRLLRDIFQDRTGFAQCDSLSTWAFGVGVLAGLTDPSWGIR